MVDGAARHHRLGVLRERHQDWVAAAAEFAQAARLDVGWAARHIRLGEAREGVWDFRGACEAFGTAVRLAPQYREWSRRLRQAKNALREFRPYGGLVVAHRGSMRGQPENAIEMLANLPATVAGVEVDVRATRDGVPVLMHDRWVDRTTDGSGRVADLSFAEVQRLSGLDGVRVPTLAAYLAGCARHDLEVIVIDVKAEDVVSLESIGTTVQESKVARSCVVVVRGTDAMRTLRWRFGDLRLGVFGTTLENVAERVAAAKRCQAEFLIVAHSDARYLRNRAVVATIQAAGLRAGASVINSREALEAARVDGCDLILTDQADQLAYFVGGLASEGAPA